VFAAPDQTTLFSQPIAEIKSVLTQRLSVEEMMKEFEHLAI